MSIFNNAVTGGLLGSGLGQVAGYGPGVSNNATLGNVYMAAGTGAYPYTTQLPTSSGNTLEPYGTTIRYILNIGEVDNGYIVTCGSKRYVCAKDTDELGRTVTMALVNREIDKANGVGS